jgi:hypothetical protein
VAPRAFSFELLGRKRHTTLMLFDITTTTPQARSLSLSVRPLHCRFRFLSLRALESNNTKKKNKN